MLSDQPSREDLARSVLQLADDAGMPDATWKTDTRVAEARTILMVPADGRANHTYLWAPSDAK